MFDQEIADAIASQAKRLGVEYAALAATVMVESNGVLFAQVNGRREPVIRFEGHYFHARLKGAARDRAVKAGLASPVAGRVKNPKGQLDRWKLLNRAVAIDAKAALESVSWGLGQVMGSHWRLLGFASVSDLVNRARAGVAGQLELMVLYIQKFGLVDELKRRDWAAFARAYNGKNYAKHGYHKKLATAYARFASTALNLSPAAPSARGMLRMGSSGLRVREIQRLLTRAGYPVTDDGDFGQATRDGVKKFQGDNGIAVDGVVGPETMRVLDRFRASPDEQPGAQPASQVKEVRDGLGAVVLGGGGVETVRQTIVEAGDQIAMAPALSWLSNGLAVAAGLLALAGIAYALHGWWRSRQTVEAPDEEEWIVPEEFA